MKFEDLKKNWNALGARDPLYGVLSIPEKRGGKWDLQQFFKIGEEEISALMQQAAQLGLQPKGAALDFGCGVGRLSQALCRYFDSVTGVDIAASMLEQARQFNRYGERCRYVLNEQPDLGQFGDASFDFIYTALVLQHMEARYAKRYISEFLRLLKPQGWLVFQVPQQAQYSPLRVALKKLTPKPLLHLYRRIHYGRAVDPNIEVEMHGIPRPEVEDLIQQGNGTLLKVDGDRYWVKKP